MVLSLALMRQIIFTQDNEAVDHAAAVEPGSKEHASLSGIPAAASVKFPSLESQVGEPDLTVLYVSQGDPRHFGQ